MNPELHLLVRQHIEALNAKFAYLIDNDLSDGVPELFSEDGNYSIFDGSQRKVSSGRSAIAAAYAARAARAARGVRTACHIFTNLHLEDVSDDQATGHCVLLLFAQDGRGPHPAMPLLVARYDDRYVRDALGVWRYRSREATALFTGDPTQTIALPLGQPDNQSA